MSNISKEAYKGCRDFFPEKKRKLDYLFSKMRQSAESFGFEPYDGPLLESIELYLAKSGEELINEQIYSFTDRGERTVAIRPEMTPTLARMVAQIHRETPKPLRWYSIPNLMRYEKPQRGRLREHWQFNCDIFGAPEGKGEVEIILLIIHFLKSLGATEQHVEVLVNDRRIVESFFTNHLRVDSKTHHELYKILDRSKKITPEALREQLQKILSNGELLNDLLDYISLKSLSDLKKFLSKHGLEESGKELFTIIEQLESCHVGTFLAFDPTIVRGLDYYTGLVFEVFDKNPENRRAICGGGAYANLLKIFNEPSLPAVGFGMGDVTLTDFLETHQLIEKTFFPQIDLLCSYQVPEAESLTWNIAMNLRSKGLNVEMTLGEQKMKKIFQLAEYKKHRYSLIIGERELADKSIQLKNLNTKETHALALDDKVVEKIYQHLTSN